MPAQIADVCDTCVLRLELLDGQGLLLQIVGPTPEKESSIVVSLDEFLRALYLEERFRGQEKD